MKAPKLIIVQVGTPPDDLRLSHGDLPDWFCRALDISRDAVEIVRVFEGEALPPPDPQRAAIITGSWAMVTDLLPWSERTAQWIRDAMAVDMPLLGVCYGHQLMAHALGGRVDYHPHGREIGCKEIRLLPDAADDVMFKAWPRSFMAHLTHMQSIIKLPSGAKVLACSEHDEHQIVRYGPRAISTQFHPEFTPEICAAVIHRRAETLREEGKNPDELLPAIKVAPHASAILRHFMDGA
jgi:GMP synthase (glutamine-hydrolysing)